MNENLFRPLTDKARFPLLSACAELPCSVLMACDGLVFMAPEDVSAARMVIEKQETDWHLYGDTRWPCRSTWVEFPLSQDTMSGACGIIVLREDIPNREADPLSWSATNNPLISILSQERGDAASQKRLEMLRTQAASSDPIPGPENATPRYIQCYCIFHEQVRDESRFVATYTDLLNGEGLPIQKYRIASVQMVDIPLCRYALHSLFYLNQARLKGMPFLSAQQLQAF